MMIDLRKHLKNQRANQLRCQMEAMENFVVQLDTDHQDDVPLRCFLLIVKMGRQKMLEKALAGRRKRAKRKGA